RHAAMSTQQSARRRMRRQGLIVAAGLLTTLLVAVPALVSYLNNVDLVDATVQSVAGKPGPSAGGASSAAKVSLDALLVEVGALERQKAHWHIPGFVGPRAAAALYEPMRAIYAKRLRAIVEGPVREQIIADVGSVGGMVRSDAGTFESAYN